MFLPENERLDISKLTSVFSDTTNAYKYYWFLSILDSLQDNGEAKIAFNDIAIRMVANVWYPLDYFKLSFGKLDGFKSIANFVSAKMVVDNSVNSPSLFNQINNTLLRYDIDTLSSKIRELLRFVPYRFLRPCFSEETKGILDHTVNRKIIELANMNFKSNPHKVIYRFIDDCIEINTVWVNYFQEHQGILRGFIYWHLVKFLQKNNPNVIGLSEKLKKPIKRDLKIANHFWKDYINEMGSLNCIYSNEKITINNFSLDHFLPWSFVAHDLLWNIIPTPKEINSQKSDILPSMGLYYNKFVDTQFEVYQYYINKNNYKILEDYSNLFANNAESLKQITFEAFCDNFKKQITPLIQSARNMGFTYPFEYKKENNDRRKKD